jgi:dTDP-4-amino-4,6-dideoxygalactose transaminase
MSLVYRLEQGPTFFRDLIRPVQAVRPEKDFCYLGSGKAAIVAILAFLKSQGILPDKMQPILVPRWLGTWVYAHMLPFGFPTIDSSASVTVALCYHQYGFPQDMDRVLEWARSRGVALIEDCAHAANSQYRGIPVGTFGDFGVFSFSKFAFCYALGGVLSGNPDFWDHIAATNRKASQSLQLFVNAVKFLDDFNLNRPRPTASRFFDGLRDMAFSRYDDQVLASKKAIGLWQEKRDHEFAVRKENYRILRGALDRYGICDHLESEGVTPYAVPLALSSDVAPAVVEKLRERGVEAGIYRFDFNRLVFAPRFEPCVLVPIHSHMSGRGMDIVISTLTDMIKLGG